jgi:hypothetical protein
LLSQSLAQCLHQLFPTAERLDQPLLLLGQKPFGEFFQPGLGELSMRIGQGLDSLEAMPEHSIEAIEMALVFDQRGAREKVELLDIEGGDAPLHRLHQGQVFAQRDRHLGPAQLGEKRQEHG